MAPPYAMLKQAAVDRGLFAPQPWYYFRTAAVLGLLFATGIVARPFFPHWTGVVLIAGFLGFVFVQIELLGHDIGHRQVVRSHRTPHLLGLIVGNLLLGLSFSQWVEKHNRHHAFPNHTDKDPDGDYPVLAMTPKQVKERPRFVRPFIAYQAFLFLFWLPFQPLVMRYKGIRHIFGGRSKYPAAEILLILVHVGLYGWFLKALDSWPMALTAFVVHHAVIGVYNGLVFAPNHTGMQYVDDASRQGFLQEQVMTARNVRGGFAVDFLFGGLNYQIEHHLFPNMPRNQLKRGQPLVRAFCQRESIPYYQTSLLGSYVDLFRHLHRVSAPLRQRRVSTPWRYSLRTVGVVGPKD